MTALPWPGPAAWKIPYANEIAEQRPDRRAVGLGGADGRRHLAIKFRLLGQEPADDAADLRLRGLAGRGATERVLHQQDVQGAIDRDNGGEC